MLVDCPDCEDGQAYTGTGNDPYGTYVSCERCGGSGKLTLDELDEDELRTLCRELLAQQAEKQKGSNK